LIRELHTYGIQTAINKKAIATQHRGLGKKLIKEAEKIVRQETKFKKIAVIAGIGTRNYWRKNSYRLKNTYMVKKFRHLPKLNYVFPNASNKAFCCFGVIRALKKLAVNIH